MMKTRHLIISAMFAIGGVSCNQKETKEYSPLINPASTEKAVNLYNFIQDVFNSERVLTLDEVSVEQINLRYLYPYITTIWR